MKNAIITGGTGMIGGLFLNHCLSSDDAAWEPLRQKKAG